MFNARAFAVARLAECLYADYIGYDALLKLGRDPRAVAHIPAKELGQNVPIGRLTRAEDGHEMIVYHYRHYLAEATKPGVDADHARVFLGGALMTLGDALKHNGYFDHHPELEMIKHMRNAVGHGNKFDIRNPEALTRYPAHTHRDTPDGTLRLELTEALHGTPFMFDFMEEYEVVADSARRVAPLTAGWRPARRPRRPAADDLWRPCARVLIAAARASRRRPSRRPRGRDREMENLIVFTHDHADSQTWQ